MKHIFFALFAVLAYTTAMVYEPQQHGYNQSDVSGIGRIIDRETRPISVRHHKVWTAAESRHTLQSLGWEVAGK